MNRQWLTLTIGALSLGLGACGGYDETNAAYDANNTAYDENTAYDAGNETYKAAESNAAYSPPAGDNASVNTVEPPTNTANTIY
ncbi:MAG: hypothetical protein ACT4OE_08325 [Sphingosinicella sp.]